MHACRPTCELFAVDTAYSSDSAAGLVTDRSYASFAIACTHNVVICAHCVTVLGPVSHSIEQFAASGMLPGDGGDEVTSGASCSSESENTKSHVYKGKVAWDEMYRGVVHISLEGSRCLSTLLALGSQFIRGLFRPL